MSGRTRRLACALAVLLTAGAACGQRGQQPAGLAPVSVPATCPPPARTTFELPGDKGINYGAPTTTSGQWLGTRWLRSGSRGQPGWEAARPRLGADLDFIVSHHLGQVVRIFIGLDQLMVWDASRGFVRYDQASLDHLRQALDMFDAHHLTVLAVLFDQEVVSSPGNFRFQALDGAHPVMRANYLRALDVFLRRFGSRSTVAGWDLFNEAYNTLGQDGGMRRPPGPDPVSPNYPDQTVLAWIQDLYHTASCAAPRAWFTVSDTTALYWRSPPATAKYQDAVDFYDIHVYDDHPVQRDWPVSLHLPYVLGEVGAGIGSGFRDQSVNARAVSFWLAQARPLGIRAVLAHPADGAVYSLRTGLTPTGRALAAAS